MSNAVLYPMSIGINALLNRFLGASNFVQSRDFLVFSKKKRLLVENAVFNWCVYTHFTRNVNICIVSLCDWSKKGEKTLFFFLFIQGSIARISRQLYLKKCKICSVGLECEKKRQISTAHSHFIQLYYCSKNLFLFFQTFFVPGNLRVHNF